MCTGIDKKEVLYIVGQMSMCDWDPFLDITLGSSTINSSFDEVHLLLQSILL